MSPKSPRFFEAKELTRYLVNLRLAPAKHDSLKAGEEYAPGISVTEANGHYTAHVSVEAADAQSALDEAKRKLDTLLTSMALRGLAFLRDRDDAKATIQPVASSLLPAGELPRMEVVGGTYNPVVLNEIARRAALQDKHPAIRVLKISGHLGLIGMPDELVRAATEHHSELPVRVGRALSLFHLGITAHDTTVSFFLFHASLESLASEVPHTALKVAVPDTERRTRLAEAIRHLLASEGLDGQTCTRILDHVQEAHATSPVDAFERYLRGVEQNATKDELRACGKFRGLIAHARPLNLDAEFHRLRVKLHAWLRAALTQEVSRSLGVTADIPPQAQ